MHEIEEYTMTRKPFLKTILTKARDVASAAAFFVVVLTVAVVATGAIGVFAMPMAENPPLVPSLHAVQDFDAYATP